MEEGRDRTAGQTINYVDDVVAAGDDDFDHGEHVRWLFCEGAAGGGRGGRVPPRIPVERRLLQRCSNRVLFLFLFVRQVRCHGCCLAQYYCCSIYIYCIDRTTRILVLFLAFFCAFVSSCVVVLVAGLLAMAMIPMIAFAGIVQMAMMTGGYGDNDVSTASAQ